MDLYQSIREQAYSLADTRAKELGVPLDSYTNWLAGKPAADVESRMIRETDDLRRLQALRR